MRACPRSRWLAPALGVGFVLGLPVAVAGQVWFADATVNQSFTSSDPLPSPLGFEVAAAALQLAGPLGLHLSYRRVSEEDHDVMSIPEVSLVRTHTMTTFGLGFSYDFVNPTDVFLTLALTGGSNWQVERLENGRTGERLSSSRVGSDRSLGLSAHLRLRPVFAGARPSFALGYDRIWGGSCPQDASCLPTRDVFAVSAGLSWMFGADVRPLGR